MAQQFYIPLLKLTQRYDRISGYFSVDSLVVVSAGLSGLINGGGRVRLIVGLHDLGPQLSQAYVLSREQTEKLIKEIGEKIALRLETVEDLFARRRLEALAWMLVEGLLEVKVAAPKTRIQGLGNGIFHEKRLLFYDEDDCSVSAVGSANETRAAWEENGENLTIHMSWKSGNLEYINRDRERFEALWNDRSPSYNVFSLPDAVERKLREKYYPERRPEEDPEERTLPKKDPDAKACGALVPAARLVLKLGQVRSSAHLGLGPVRLYPHQVYASDFVLNKFPHRALMADEVGLGKTIEVGAVVKRLLDQGTVERVLILAPKNVAPQWQGEMLYHFNLPFWRLETGPKRLIGPMDEQVALGASNAFDHPGADLLVASWHYARGSSTRRPEVLDSKRFFDLIVVDEAHAARKLRALGKNSPTLLNELCMELSTTCPHMILVTATPVQLNELEAWDLLRILGLGGPWAHESSFKLFYDTIRENGEDEDQWVSAFNLAAWVGRSYLSLPELESVVRGVVSDPMDADNVIREIHMGGDGKAIVHKLLRRNRDQLRRLLVGLSPVHWFMVRNNRDRLKELGYTFPERIVDEVEVKLDGRHQAILERLNSYLKDFYGLYERLGSELHRGKYGFVKSVYHQRFVSSFTAAYLTVTHRLSFLRALLSEDHEALLTLASQLLKDVDWEGDEENIVESALDLLRSPETRDAVDREIEVLEGLRFELSDYSPESQSGNDPKMRAIRDEVDRFIAQRRQILVFSKYTDTVDAVVRFLCQYSNSLVRADIGIYTGEGGQLVDERSGRHVFVGKEKVREALDKGQIRVMVCSDAAREGLNLQSASVVINVDMPWNPARVEQRIGRVDRLGQRAGEVIIRNVWYPESIEAEMYRRLFKRGETYKLVIGPSQEIISDALRRALDENLSGQRLVDLVEETLREVDRVKTVGYALSMGSQLEVEGVKDARFVQLLAEFGLKASRALGLEAKIEGEQFTVNQVEALPRELLAWNNSWLVPGKPNALTAAHPIVRWLADTVIEFGRGCEREVDESLFLAFSYGGLADLIRIGDGAPERLSDIDKTSTTLEKLLEASE